jgi:hypothetical protein
METLGIPRPTAEKCARKIHSQVTSFLDSIVRTRRRLEQHALCAWKLLTLVHMSLAEIGVGGMAQASGITITSVLLRQANKRKIESM